MNIKNNKELKKFHKDGFLREDGTKTRGIGRLINSFSFAFQGIWFSIKNEQNLVLQFFIMLIVIGFGIAFKITKIEWLFIVLMSGFIFAAELINTSIEATIDLNTKKYNKLAKVAKDTGSGAVLVLAIVSVIGGVIIFLPYFIDFMRS